MRRTIVLGLLVAAAFGAVVARGVQATAAGTWTWPVRGPIVRPYDPPASPYGTGHRGIDIAVPLGTVVVAPAPGVVSFAGRVAGQLFVSIDHGAGLVSTSSYLSASLVAKDDPVVAGQPIGLSGAGHPGSATAHLHFGVRLGGIYVDPLDYLAPLSLVGILWLAPILGPTVGPAPGPLTPRAVGPESTIVPRGRPRNEPSTTAYGTRPSPLRGRPVPT
jgi:murein DD-endopeptidase MepM/ murein hydrolase activator NlpD